MGKTKKFYYFTTNEAGENVSNQVTNVIKETNAVNITRIYALYKQNFKTQYADTIVQQEILIIPNDNASKSLIYKPMRSNTVVVKYKNDYIIGIAIVEESPTSSNLPNAYVFTNAEKIKYAITGKTGIFEKCNKLEIEFDPSGSKFGKIHGRRITVK